MTVVQFFVVLLLMFAIVLAVVASFGVPSRLQLGWLAVACFAGAFLLPALQAM